MHCVFHDDCSDGFCSAWVVRSKYPAAVFHPTNYGDPPPDIPAGKTLIIADFSFSPEVLEEYCKICRKVVVLDHHLSAVRMLGSYYSKNPKPDNLELHLDMSQSGAGLTWRYLYPELELNWLVAHVEDYDLWRFKYPMSESIAAYIKLQPYEFAAWDNMLLQTPEEASRIGRLLLAKERHDVSWHLHHVCFRAVLGGYLVPFANAPRYLASKLANAMAKDQPFAVTYYDDEHIRHYSLRSEEGAVDVSLIAEQFAGGGHPTSAGFTRQKKDIVPGNVV